MTCVICLSPSDATNSTLKCNNQHAICGECFKQHLKINGGSEQFIDFHQIHEAPPCPLLCGDKIDQDIVLESHNAKLYFTTVQEITRLVTIKEIKTASMKKIDADPDSTKNIILLYITKLLSSCIACPMCKQVFVDFGGCLALTCHKCRKSFCGFCQQIHTTGDYDTNDIHACVKYHFENTPRTERNKYGFIDNYFISENGWDLLKDKIKLEAVIKYLKELKINILWNVFEDIVNMLTANKLLLPENIELLIHRICSHDHGGAHLLRIPAIFWTILSTKTNQTIESCIIQLTPQEKMEIGNYVIAGVRREFPHWRPIKYKVPGETFYAVSYPPEFASVIYEQIVKWGCDTHLW